MSDIYDKALKGDRTLNPQETYIDIKPSSDAQKFHELTGGKLHYEIESIQKDYYYCSCGFVEKDRSAFNGHIAKHNPTYSTAADILNRMKEFCGEIGYKLFLCRLLYAESCWDDLTENDYDGVIYVDYVTDPPALIKKAVEFLEAYEKAQDK